jgi:hypothetical protein
MKGHGDPKHTDPIGGKGKGKGGRKTYIDEIISKSESAAQRPNLWKQKSQPSFQENFETGKEFWCPETVQKPAGNIEDRASAVGEQTEENTDEYNEELHHEEQAGPEGEVNDENSFSTLGFPISDLPRGVAPMKNIPLSTLSNFHGLSSEDPNEFLFEFDILCRSYDYVSNAKKLKLFPATLKGNALIWFMSLGGHVITTWDQMK